MILCVEARGPALSLLSHYTHRHTQTHTHRHTHTPLAFLRQGLSLKLMLTAMSGRPAGKQYPVMLPPLPPVTSAGVTSLGHHSRYLFKRFICYVFTCMCVCACIGVHVPNVCRGLQSLRLRPTELKLLAVVHQLAWESGLEPRKGRKYS